MKICSKCKLKKEESDFHTRSRGGLYSHCKMCQREYTKNHYNQNKPYYLKKAKTYSDKLIEWYRELKKTLRCSKCGENHPATLEFNHRDPSEKVKEVSIMVARGWGKRKILKEIEKCSILCANCHRIMHWEERFAGVV
jgi:hypothetical protein